MKNVVTMLLVLSCTVGMANAVTLVDALGTSGGDEGLNGNGTWTHPAPDVYTNTFKLALNFHGPSTTTLINEGGTLDLTNFPIGGSGDATYIQNSGVMTATGQVDLGFKADPAVGKIVMNGGIFQTVWMNVGFTDAGVGRLEVNGGAVEVAAQFNLQDDSSIDLTNGVITAGWEMLHAVAGIADGRITGFGSSANARYSLPGDGDNPVPGKYTLWAVPEPITLSLLGLGGLAVLRRRNQA